MGTPTTTRNPSESSAREALFDIVNGYFISQALYVAAKLGIANRLKEGPKSCDELAASCQAHSPSLYRILRTLASVKVFCELDDRRFRLTPLAELLQSDVPGSLSGWTIMRGEAYAWKPWGEILYSVKTGRSAFNRVFGMPAFEYFGNNPASSATFDDAMRSVSAQKYRAVADAYDFSSVGTMVDVGGGNGGLITAILDKNPKMKGVLSDLPHVIEGAKSQIEAAGLGDRCQCVSIDMFESVPTGGDAYIMANVIHDWDDERSILILKNCRRAITDAGRVLLVEMVLSPPNEPHRSKLADLEMLVMTEGGKERTESEYDELFKAAALRRTRIVSTESPWSVIEAVAG